MHRAWSSIVEVPYCFSRWYVKLQGHTALKIVEFDPNWAFPDCNSSLNSPMSMKCCTKLETAKERCPIVFQGHPSNFKVTRYKTSPIFTQIGCFRTIGRSQLSNPSDLPCLPAIQIRWKHRLAITLLLAIRSQPIFAHGTTVQLSCHVQNIVAITVLESRWVKRNFHRIWIAMEKPLVSNMWMEANEAHLKEYQLKLSTHHYVKNHACIDNPAYRALHEFDQTTIYMYTGKWKRMHKPVPTHPISLKVFMASA